MNLRGGRPGLRLEQLEEGFEDAATASFRYRVLCLSGCRAEEYLARPEPLAWAFAAVMRPDRWSRAELKIECLRRIAEAHLPALHEHLLANWVETYLQLAGRDAADFEKLRALATNREIKSMQMTWAEKMEKEYTEKGRREGVRSLREVVLELLGQRFGEVPVKVKRKVQKIDSMDRLTEMAKKVLVVQSLDEMGLS